MSFKTFIGNLRNLARADVNYFSGGNVTVPTFSGGNPSDAMAVPGANRPAESSILAFACITTRREAVAGAPLMLTDGSDRQIESGPLFELLQNPNAALDWQQWIRVLETHLALYNVCAVVPIGEAGAMPEALDSLHPAGLTPEMGVYEPTGTPRVVRWRYIDPTTGSQREFAPQDVVVHVGYNPHSPLSALAPVNVLKRTLLADIASREQNLGLFQNDATPRGYLHSDSVMTREQAQEVLSTWNSLNQGYANRHKTAATWGGLKYDKLQLSPAELEFLESLKAMRIDYYMAFRVYPAMLAEMTGETGLSQGSSTDEQRVAWWEDVGIPELNLIAGIHQKIVDRIGGGLKMQRGERELTRTQARVLSRKAVRPGAAVNIWFNESAIPALARHRAGRIDAAVKLATTLGYRPDEVSEWLNLGLPPHPDNIGRVPFALSTIPQAEPPNVEPAGAGAARLEADALLDRIEALARAESTRRVGKRAAFEQHLGKLERQAAERWSRFFLEQRGRVLQRAQKSGLTRAAGEEWQSAIFPRAEEDMHLVARLSPLWAEQVVRGAAMTEEEIGVPLANPFTVADPRVKAIVEKRTIQGYRVNDTTEDALRGFLREWAEGNLSQGELIDSIAGYYRENCIGADKVRPDTAARTQTAGIVNEGRLAAAEEVGGLLKYWIHGDSQVPRETHLAAAQNYGEASAIRLDAKFVVGGEEMDAPGDSEATIGNVANCSCFLGLTKERR